LYYTVFVKIYRPAESVLCCLYKNVSLTWAVGVEFSISKTSVGRLHPEDMGSSSSTTLVYLYRTARRHIAEYSGFMVDVVRNPSLTTYNDSVWGRLGSDICDAVCIGPPL